MEAINAILGFVVGGFFAVVGAYVAFNLGFWIADKLGKR